MQHEMHLNERPFRLLQAGRKTVELRVNDEKRRRIKVGDEILFERRGAQTETLLMRVTELIFGADFTALLPRLTSDELGLSAQELPDVAARMQTYYPLEEQQLYGVVGIRLELLD